MEKQLEQNESYEVNIACEIDGETYYKHFVFYTVDRQARFYLMLNSDTTEAFREEHEQNERLQEALDDARKASEAKSVFLSNMSHDIRTPMNAIISYTNLARRDDIEQEQIRDYLDKIDSSNQHLLALINDVLEMSRIESGKIELEPIPIDLRVMLEEVRDMFATQMHEKEIDFTVSCDDIRRACVLCDKNRLNRVLLNLLSNAYKFTPENGRITVSLTQLEGGTADAGDYELRVADSGIGMSAEFAAKVFEPFERERTSTVSGIQGTGLGMAITKSIVDLMGGTIRVDTAPGEGTEFIIRLTFDYQKNVVEAEGEDDTQQESKCCCDFSRIRLHLVEDIDVNREIASFILTDMGFKVEAAENGQIAVDKVTASEPRYYDLILMDVQMPVMNGYEATKAIRSLPEEAHSRIPIIAMTANAFSEDVKEAEEAGMNDHIAKPLDVDIMKKTIMRVLGAVRK